MQTFLLSLKESTMDLKHLVYFLNHRVDGALKFKHKSLLIKFGLWCVFTNTNLHEMHNDRLWRNIICIKNNAKKDATKSSNSRIASLATYLQRSDENKGKPKITSLEQVCLMYNVVYECIVYHCIHMIRYSLFMYVHDVI